MCLWATQLFWPQLPHLFVHGGMSSSIISLLWGLHEMLCVKCWHSAWHEARARDMSQAIITCSHKDNGFLVKVLLAEVERFCVCRETLWFDASALSLGHSHCNPWWCSWNSPAVLMWLRTSPLPLQWLTAPYHNQSLKPFPLCQDTHRFPTVKCVLSLGHSFTCVCLECLDFLRRHQLWGPRC